MVNTVVNELLCEKPKDPYVLALLAGQHGERRKGKGRPEHSYAETSTPRPLPPWATKHMPGTLMKIEVMAWRWENGYAVHHPDDAKDKDDPKRCAPEVLRRPNGYPLRLHLLKKEKTLLETLREEDGQPLTEKWSLSTLRVPEDD